MMHVPLLRWGRPYESVQKTTVVDFRNNNPVATVSQANPGLIARDLGQAAVCRRALEEVPVSVFLDMCRKASRHFMESDLPVGDALQSPSAYLECVSMTTGMPQALGRKNMQKISSVLEHIESVLAGLTRGLNLSIFDSGRHSEEDRPLGYFCETNALGAILPNNSPGVHSIWLPAIPLKVPLALKPGREEPWTPFRIAQAFLKAGSPPEAFGFYPTSYSGGTEILLRCDRSLLFGDESTIGPWKHDRRIQIHGPGWSKILIGEDKISEWDRYLDVILASVVENGGRSCINASGLWVTSGGREIAEAIAKRLAGIEARTMEDPQAQLAAFPNPGVAWRINGFIDSQLQVEGAADLTHPLRGKRLVEKDGATYLLPTVVWCEDATHPLANTEFLFPFVSIVQVSRDQLLERMGHTLVLTAITEDEALIRDLLSSRGVQRLNLGAIPTNKIAWDQPHEGNLFEHLYTRRALQTAIS